MLTNFSKDELKINLKLNVSITGSSISQLIFRNGDKSIIFSSFYEKCLNNRFYQAVS